MVHKSDLTREELHAQVWSQPMTALAKSIGISDVALAKRCRAASVPVPPRGWWAQKEAGKPVQITPLPPLPFVMTHYFPAFDRPLDRADDDEAGLEPPKFRDLLQVQEEIRAAVKTVKVPADLNRPHPIVARLLKQDAERPAYSGRYDSYREQRFTIPVQQRRLRILSCLLTELQRLGCKPSGSTHAGERFSLGISGSWTYISLTVEPDTSQASRPFFERARPTGRERLRFDIVDHDDRIPAKQSWRENETPLERQVTQIIQSLLLQAEDDTRRWALQTHAWRREDRERRVREAKVAAEAAERQRLEKEAAAAAARIDALVTGADTLERAARIRRYVEAVKLSASDGSSAVTAEQLDRWSAWALAQADLIDPVVSGRFVEDLNILVSLGGNLPNSPDG